jgi:hypothetical protein
VRPLEGSHGEVRVELELSPYGVGCILVPR